MDSRQKLIEVLFEKDILISRDFLESPLDMAVIDKATYENDLLVLTLDYSPIIASQRSLVDWYDLDSYRVAAEKGHNNELYHHQIQSLIPIDTTSLTHPHSDSQPTSSKPTSHPPTTLQPTGSTVSFPLSTPPPENFPGPSSSDSISLSLTPPTLLSSNPQFTLSPSSGTVTVISSYQNTPRKYAVSDFTNLFYSRYKYLEGLLRHREELRSATTINRILSRKEKATVTAIGLIESIGETKNGNIIITLEDPTGRIKVVFSKREKDLFMAASDLVVDEVIAITGQCSENYLFAQNIIWPDIPPDHELKKGPVEEYAIFLSDIHVGSKLFLKEEFTKFLRWINGLGSTPNQRCIAEQVKYIFIAGDLVDGIGIYPNQESELAITDITGQYAEFSRLISQIPPDKQIIICPGNHDAVHLAEPQPSFYSEFAPHLFTLPNVTLVTNPSMIKIAQQANFDGFDILMYHGYSFDYYVANVASIRNNGGYHRSDLIMKYLLKRRHLAPSFSSTPYHPGHNDDPLLIKNIPDFFITGHIHYCCVANYRGITMISGSCWQAKTSFQEKLGHHPEPARVPLINLKTRQVTVMRFS